MNINKFDDCFDERLYSNYIKGKSYHDIFVERINDFFTTMDHHIYVAGQPGVGKTYTAEEVAKLYPNIYLLIIKGAMTPWAFIKTIAVNVYMLRNTGMKLAVFIDDMNNIFKHNSPFLDMFKIAMDKKSGDRLEYNTSLGAQLDACEDFEREAIEYFKSLTPNRTGFIIPFEGNVKFIFTMNTPLPGKQQMEKLKMGSDEWIKMNNRAAIRSRVKYNNLIMDKDTYWGWIAYVTWNKTSAMCVGASEEQRYKMLTWLWDNWDVASETSLRFVEEQLWDDMKKHPREVEYRKRWEQLKESVDD